ncbi:MAG: acyltransferase [Verrucomicrobiota bacterium]
MLSRFKRITTSGDYIAEIDGLRFVAIATVIFVHITGIWTVNVGRSYDELSLLDRLLMDATLLGGYGVELFFMISGFVLAMPFCKNAYQSGPRIDVKKYFWRRVTRLEPPYVVSMLFFFVMMPIWGKGNYEELLPNLLASLAYMHNAIYSAGSVINNNAWSLEVEIQFYLLVPLILKILCFETLARRMLLISAVMFFSSHRLWLAEDFPISILQFFQYFALGILFCELRTTDWSERTKATRHDWPGFLAWPLFFLLNLGGKSLITDLANPWLIGFFFYSALWGRWHSRILSWSFIPIVGGMCYSIYLLHARILSLVLHKGFGNLALTGNFTLDFLFLSIFCFPIVVLLSGIFFWMIEKPCMNPNWPSLLRSKLLSWKKSSEANS